MTGRLKPLFGRLAWEVGEGENAAAGATPWQRRGGSNLYSSLNTSF